MTSQNSNRTKYFTTLSYTADGSCVLAGGRSKYICIYCVASGTLVKKFQLSHNRSLEGVLDQLRSDQLVDGVNMSALVDEDEEEDPLPTSRTPGAQRVPYPIPFLFFLFIIFFFFFFSLRILRLYFFLFCG